MKTSRAVLIPLALVALLLAAAPMGATTVSECQALINVLKADTEAATSLSARDQAGLLGKASNASIKLDQGKFGDALGKLEEYQSKVETLHDAAKPKISDEDYATLSADVGDAIACVQNLIAGV